MKNITFVALLENQHKKMNSWKQLFEQEKVNYSESIFTSTKIVVTNDYIQFGDEIKEFVNNGGICVVEKPDFISEINLIKTEESLVTRIHFPEYSSVNISYPSIAFTYNPINLQVNSIGYFKLLEERVPKTGVSNGYGSIFHTVQYGKGKYIVSSLEFDNYLNYNGNTLREIKSHSTKTEVTERISHIDKELVKMVLIRLLKNLFDDQGIPWIQFSYFPKDVSSIFMFRIDVDGSDKGIVDSISKLGKKYRIPITFYLSKSLIDGSAVDIEELNRIDSIHDIGNHGDIHNVYDKFEENYENIKECEEWMKASFNKVSKGFVAPRGIWTKGLEEAVIKAGYDYSSDFGYCINGFPFRPYYENQPSKVLQIPVNPYCVSRAEIYYDGKKDYFDDEDILEYFFNYINSTLSENGTKIVYLYGHPNGIGHRLGILEAIFKFVSQNNVQPMAIREFVDWWKYREEAEYTLNYVNNHYQVHFKKNPLNFVMNNPKK